MAENEKTGLEKWAATPATRGEAVDPNLYKSFLGKSTVPFGMKEEEYLGGLLKGLTPLQRLRIENQLQSVFEDGVRLGKALGESTEPSV